METRIYLFNGFLDSGKSTFINDTITQTDFCKGERTLLLIFEEGEIAYNQELIESFNVDLVYLKPQDWQIEKLNELKNKYHPTQVIVEVNGMMDVTEVVNTSLPMDWTIVQSVVTIDASTFSLYLNNLRSLVYSQVVNSELVIFNRVDENMKKSFLRNNIKAINNYAQIIYEKSDGTVNTFEDEPLPYDINAPILEIEDCDFGIFCLDALENAKTYAGKTVRLKGKMMGLDATVDNGFILGRQAMICCEEDTKLIGIICESKYTSQLIQGEWLIVEGVISLLFDPKLDVPICLLHVTKLQGCLPLKQEYVTFD